MEEGFAELFRIMKEEESIKLAFVKLRDETSPGETSFLYLQKEASIQSTCPVTGAVMAYEGQKTLKESESKIPKDFS